MHPVQTKYADAEALDFLDAITLRLFLSGSQTDGTQAIFEDIVAPSVGPGRHIYHGQDEIFLFLEGSFDVEIDGFLYHMEPGDNGFVLRETVHVFKNVGMTPGRLRYILSPVPQMEKMFRALFKAQGDGSLSEATMAEVAMDHGQSFVGPSL